MDFSRVLVGVFELLLTILMAVGVVYATFRAMIRANTDFNESMVNCVNLCSLILRQCLFFFFMASFLTACVSDGPYQFNLMPAPDVYDDGTINPFVDENPIDNLPYGGVLYATDREPAGEEHKEDYYQNKRGHVLRLGAARYVWKPLDCKRP